MLASYIAQQGALFGRVYSLTLSNNDGVGAVWGNESPGQSPLRIVFDFERKNTGPAEGKLALFNLSAASRNNLQRGTQIALRAGYVGSMSLVFAGVVKEVKTQRDGPDLVSELQCVDGINFTNYAVLDKAYQSGTPLYQVLQDLARAMQIDVSAEQTLSQTGVVVGIPNANIAGPLVLTGPVRHSITMLCRKYNLVWSIVNNQLRVRPKDHYNTMQIVVLGRDSGLINNPGFNGELLTFDCLLLPGVTPGALVQINSLNQQLTGFYLVTKTKVSGDTFGASWHIQCEGTRYEGSVEAIASNVGSNLATAVQTTAG